MGAKKAHNKEKTNQLSTLPNGKPENSVKMEEECELNILSRTFCIRGVMDV
jgi:hypothetical protein